MNNACLMGALLYYSKKGHTTKGHTTIKEMKNAIFFNTRNTKYISYADVCNTMIRCFVQELGLEEVEGIYLKKHE